LSILSFTYWQDLAFFMHMSTDSAFA